MVAHLFQADRLSMEISGLISVVIPVYNKGPHVGRAINSVLGQTKQEFELILINDASTDESLRQMEAFDDPRIRIVHRQVPGPGGYAARNLGVSIARSEFVAFLDADDEWKPDFLAKVYEAILSEPVAGAACSAFEFQRGETIIRRDLSFVLGQSRAGVVSAPFQKMARSGFIHTPCVMVRRAVFEQVGGFPEECKRGGDMLLWYRMMKTAPVVFVNEVLQRTYLDAVNRVSLRHQQRITPIALELKRDIESGADDADDLYEWYVRSRLTVIRESIEKRRQLALLSDLWDCRHSKLHRIALVKTFGRFVVPKVLRSLWDRQVA